MKKYIFAPAFTTSAVLSPFFSSPHIPPLLFTVELKTGRVSFLPGQWHEHERNQSIWIPIAAKMEVKISTQINHVLCHEHTCRNGLV